MSPDSFSSTWAEKGGVNTSVSISRTSRRTGPGSIPRASRPASCSSAVRPAASRAAAQVTMRRMRLRSRGETLPTMPKS